MTQDIDINDNIIQDNSDDIYNKAELEIVKEDDDFFPYIIKGNIEIVKGIGYTWLYVGGIFGSLAFFLSWSFFKNCKGRI